MLVIVVLQSDPSKEFHSLYVELSTLPPFRSWMCDDDDDDEEKYSYLPVISLTHNARIVPNYYKCDVKRYIHKKWCHCPKKSSKGIRNFSYLQPNFIFLSQQRSMLWSITPLLNC